MSAVAAVAPAQVVATWPSYLHHSLRRLADGSRPPTPEGSLPAFAWGDVATPIRPITGRPSLSPSSFTCCPIGSPRGSLSPAPLAYGAGRTTGLPHSADVPEWPGRISTPVAHPLRRRSSGSPDLATYLLVQAVQQLALVPGDDAWDAVPGLTLPLHPGCRPPGCWQSQLRLAPGLPSRRRRLRCPGACYPGRIPLAEQRVQPALSEYLRTATSATSCRTRMVKLSSRLTRARH
jgi:hypothetical protein